MKIILSIILLLVILLITFEPKVTLSPFKITFLTPYKGLAVVFLVTSFIMWDIQYRTSTNKRIKDLSKEYIKVSFDAGVNEGIKIGALRAVKNLKGEDSREYKNLKERFDKLDEEYKDL